MRSTSFASGNEMGMLVLDRKNGSNTMELTGEELDEYCRNRGLCNRCAKVVTHKRVVKLFGKDVKWEPLTIRKGHQEMSPLLTDTMDLDASGHENLKYSNSNKTNEYSVYKGYCLKEHTCYTLAEAKRLLGEDSPKKSSRFRITMNKNVPKRPGKRRMRTNPETGSVAGSIASYASSLSGFSRGSQATANTRSSVLSGMSGLSGISGFSIKSKRKGSNHSNKKKLKDLRKSSSSASWSAPNVKDINDLKSFDGSEITVEELDFSARTAPAVATSLSSVTGAHVSPIVAHRVEQLVKFDYFVDLHLSKTDLSTATGWANIDALTEALRNAKTIEMIALERCSLDNEGIEKLAGGLEAGGHMHNYFRRKDKRDAELESMEFTGAVNTNTSDNTGVLKSFRLRGNRIGNRGVQALEFLFRSSSTLEELDLSDNCIGSMGAASILESLGQNYEGIPLSILNLSQNEIWDLSANTDAKVSHRSIDNSQRTYSFLHNNSTLRELSLDGNCLHDDGAEYIAEALMVNKFNGVLRKLHLGWNGIGDNGAIALSRALESNNTIKVLGLAENDITNIGARAILSALAVNVSMKEISGLYHNRIDRKFIIVAIKRLLHRTPNHGFQDEDETLEAIYQDSSHKSEESVTIEAVVTAEETEETESATSSSSFVDNCNKRLSSDPKKQQQNQNSASTLRDVSNSSGGSHALEAIENWDWGTFGIDEIEERKAEDTESQIDHYLKGIEKELSQNGDDPIDLDSEATENGTKRNSKPPPPTDRLVVFQAAPLAHFDRKSMQHHGVPLLDFASEAEAIKEIFAIDENSNLGAVEVVFETATQNNFHDFFTKSWSPVMHFSCYGNPDCIALENGFGYMQALSLDALKKIVATATSSHLEVVVVSSCHANYLAEAFLHAGVQRVVSLPRDAAVFHDQGPIDFARGFYATLLQSRSIKEAFEAGINECTKSSSQQSTLLDSYKLLPEGANHDVPIFFQTPPPAMIKTLLPTDISRDEDPTDILPKLPDHFFGREVDIYEILESLRVDDVIRIGGARGSGKKSILSVLSRYILERSKSFQIDSVFWLPPPSGEFPDPDSLYGLLCMVFQWIVVAEDDVWDDEDYKQARERILIEMEGRNSILVIDGRVFTNEIAGEMLERFLSLLLNEVNVKIILMTANETSRSKTKHSSSEETTVYLGPLDFQSTVKLYGNACPHIASTDDSESFISTIDTIEEFESYISLGLSATTKETAGLEVLDSETPKQSHRQKELYNSMGCGNPREILRMAINCTTKDFTDLLKIAQRPNVSVSTSKELDEQRGRWVAEMDHAINRKYYLRARDIVATLGELVDLKNVYPSLEDMKAKEDELRKRFSALLKAKRYDDANLVKRKILSLKRTMVKEQYSSSSSKDDNKDAYDTINKIQERMKSIMALAESMNTSSASNTAGEENQKNREATFLISEGCTLEISCGRLASFWKDSASTRDNTAMVIWTNEACDISGDDETMAKVLGDAVIEEVSSMETLTNTEFGSVKCATGDSVVVGTGAGCIVLAIPPLPFTAKNSSLIEKDEDSVQYLERNLCSAIRSSLRKIRRKIGSEMVVGISTTLSVDSYRDDIGESDELRRRNLAVTLNTIVKELRQGNNTKMTVRLFASSGRAESMQLIKMASELGLQTASLASLEQHGQLVC